MKEDKLKIKPLAVIPPYTDTEEAGFSVVDNELL
jgi:hypothetical protein